MIAAHAVEARMVSIMVKSERLCTYLGKRPFECRLGDAGRGVVGQTTAAVEKVVVNYGSDSMFGSWKWVDWA